MVDQTETNNTIEAVDMDVEYEDCSSELADTAITCNGASVEVFSENKDTKRPSEGVELQLVDETQSNKIKNYTKGQAKLISHNSQEEDQIAGRLIKCQTCEFISIQFQVEEFQRNGCFLTTSLCTTSQGVDPEASMTNVTSE